MDRHNDAWRFTPNGIYCIRKLVQRYYKISTIALCRYRRQPQHFIAEAVYVPCSGGVNDTVSDTITVALSGTLNAGLVSTVNVTALA